MNKLNVVFLCFALAVAAAGQGIPGGLSGEKGEVQRMITYLRPQIQKWIPNTYYDRFIPWNVITYRTQVVSGTNYFVKVSTGKGRYIHVKIYKKLGQNQRGVVTGVLTGQSLYSPIEYW